MARHVAAFIVAVFNLLIGILIVVALMRGDGEHPPAAVVFLVLWAVAQAVPVYALHKADWWA